MPTVVSYAWTSNHDALFYDSLGIAWRHGKSPANRPRVYGDDERKEKGICVPVYDI